jgi:hypothetical protein
MVEAEGILEADRVDGSGRELDQFVIDAVMARLPELGSGRRQWPNDVSFDRAVFKGDVSFTRGVFPRGSAFDGAVFEGEVRFSDVEFQGPASFLETTFKGPDVVLGDKVLRERLL